MNFFLVGLLFYRNTVFSFYGFIKLVLRNPSASHLTKFEYLLSTDFLFYSFSFLILWVNTHLFLSLPSF